MIFAVGRSAIRDHRCISSAARTKFWEWPNIFDFKRATVFGAGHRLSKHMLEIWGEWPLLYPWLRLCFTLFFDI